MLDLPTAAHLEREPSPGHRALAGFHPAVGEWFMRRFPDGPTEPQARGWALIARGLDTLIAAPTGSGKTLAHLALELPEGELEAVASADQFGDVLDRIAAYVRQHRTTLVFVNTRNLAERVAHQLGERLGDDVVSAHHGSLSKERRQRVETRLPAGDLKALVATASLELGIDIGPVELVCQIGSPRSIATFLQRVGRSNHSRTGTTQSAADPAYGIRRLACRGVPSGRGLPGQHRRSDRHPDHVLVRQTVDDTLHEALDVDGVRALLERIEAGEVQVHCCDTTEPSVLAHEIITARPYAFLDDEETQNRRTNAARLRRGLPTDLATIGGLDQDAIERVHAEITPLPETADDLHDLLSSTLLLRPRSEWSRLWLELVERGRGRIVANDGIELWTTTEALADARDALAGDDAVVVRIVRGHLELSGITTAEALSVTTTLPPDRVASGLLALEREGFAMQGRYRAGAIGAQWVTRGEFRYRALGRHPTVAGRRRAGAVGWCRAWPGDVRRVRRDPLEGSPRSGGAPALAVLAAAA